IVRGNEWRNLDFGRISDRLKMRQPINDMPVMSSEPPVETPVQSRGYMQLPQTCISLTLHSLRSATRRCRMSLHSFLPNNNGLSALHGSPPAFHQCSTSVTSFNISSILF
ncbi:hypothetical protein HAX54_010860, partial [Datura stramonium]|nr:hypothetical protein [Datura stramonium]